MRVVKLQYVSDNMAQLAEEFANLINTIHGLELSTNINDIAVESHKNVTILFHEQLDESDIKELQDEIDCTGFTWVK